MIYLLNVGHVVQALDARTGDLIWEHHVGPAATRRRGTWRSTVTKLFIATNDARLVALDARNGQDCVGDAHRRSRDGYRNTSGPMVIHGKVIQGLGGCDEYKEAGCYISAVRCRKRQAAVEVLHGRREGTPGGDTWGKLPNLFRAGGDTWITGSYDPELNLMYWGVAQPKPGCA